MTAKYDPALCERLIAEASEQYALTERLGYGVQAGTISALADQLSAARLAVDAAAAIEAASQRTIASWVEAYADRAKEIEVLPNQRDSYAEMHKSAEREADAMRPVVDTAVRVAELDEICDAHPGINDDIGQRAESELYTAVAARTAAVDAYREARDKAGG